MKIRKIKMIQSVGTLDGGFGNGREYDTDRADEFIRHGWAEPVMAAPATPPVETTPATTPTDGNAVGVATEVQPAQRPRRTRSKRNENDPIQSPSVSSVG